jgi:hypothetical protein
MLLGAEHCRILGGVDFVLRHAPAALVSPLGEGVWLQLSDQPPASPEHRQHLAEFLQPVLTWTGADVRAIRAHLAAQDHSDAWQRIGPTEPDAPTRARARRQLRRTVRPTLRKSVPIFRLSELDIDSALSIELAAPPSPLQHALIEAIVDEWYRKGVGGGFGDGGFHMLRGPAVDGAVLTWAIDFGSGDAPAALGELSEKLAAAPEVAVIGLSVGVQTE